MTTKETFIQKISTALGHDKITKPEPFNFRYSVHKEIMSSLSQESLKKIFIEYSETIGVKVFECHQENLNEKIKSILDSLTKGLVVVTNDRLLQEKRTVEYLQMTGEEIFVWGNNLSREENIKNVEKASVGITVVQMALAESATVLLYCQKTSGRSVTLLPESTLYIIPQSAIQPRLTQAMNSIHNLDKKNLPSSINFVSGPSATSDIELVRVVGVHGPVNVIHLIVTDI